MNYKQIPIQVLRSRLETEHDLDAAELRKMSKDELCSLMERAESGSNPTEEQLEEAENAERAFEQAIEAGQEEEGIGAAEPLDRSTLPLEYQDHMTRPSMDSPEWNDYVMSQFVKDELENGCPTTDGLRRITELLIGPIVEETPVAIQVPTRENMATATIMAQIRVLNNIKDHAQEGQFFVVGDIADCNDRNTDAPYHLHASATAFTRAAGRAYRKLLRLRKVYAAEEKAKKIDDGSSDNRELMDTFVPDELITEQQITVIDVMCQRVDYNVMKFINSGKLGPYASIKQVTNTAAMGMIQHLNKLQQGKEEKKDHLLGYDSAWRV